MLPPLADVSALEDWLGIEPLEGPAASRAGAYLAAASNLVRRETGRAWITDEDSTLDESSPTIDADDLAVVSAVVVQIVERKWNNPTGVVQQTKGPFSESYGQAAALGLYLTDAEKEQLSAFRTSSKPGLWAMRTSRGDCLSTTYVDVDPPGKPLPVLDAYEPW